MTSEIAGAVCYVSTQFHYIGIAFGIGRYQPHSAAEVLANQYGDCKDKHTLLASLLTAAGIPAYPALINTSREVDEEVPSPGQFDHVITVVPRRRAGVARHHRRSRTLPIPDLTLARQACAGDLERQPPALVSTPAELPYGTTQTFNMDAKLNDAGTLEGHANFSRGAMWSICSVPPSGVPLPQWKELVQRISFGFRIRRRSERSDG